MRKSAKKENENKNLVLKWKCWVHILLYTIKLYFRNVLAECEG